jgi:hypothetical protein
MPKSPATLSYSAVFNVTIRSGELPGSTIFYSEELSIKSTSGKLISGKIISCESENLPVDFDIRNYPGYIFGLVEAENISPDLVRLFKNTRNEIDYVYGVDNLSVKRNKGVSYYSLCNDLMCLAYIVKESYKDHIFTLNVNGFDADNFNEFIQGEINVK